MHNISSIASRLLFIGAVVVVVLAICEKLANLTGRTLVFLLGYTPSRLLEFAVAALVFVIAIQLRELRYGASGQRGGG